MFLPETTSLCPGDNFFVPLAPQRQLGRFDVCQASQHLKPGAGDATDVRERRPGAHEGVENGGPSSNGLIAEAGLPGQLGRGTTSRRQDDDQDRKQPAPG